MITEQQRQWAENVIACLRAKLEGKKVEYCTGWDVWSAVRDDDWNFHAMHNYRIAPEPQEKMKLWCVDDGKIVSPTFGQLSEAETYRRNACKGGTIIELTETARIEPETPKKREPRRIWHNRYGGQWGYFAFHSAEAAKEEAITGNAIATETAVEFVEVIK